MSEFPKEIKVINPDAKEPEKLVLGTELRRMVEKYSHSIAHVSPMLHKAMVKAYQQGVRDLTDKINEV